MPDRGRRGIIWVWACRLLGLSIVTIIFGLFAASAVTKRVHMDEAVALSFLGIGSVLAGLPSGLSVVVSRGQSSPSSPLPEHGQDS